MSTSLEFLPQISTRFVAALIAAVIVSYVVVRLTAGPASSLARRRGLVALRALMVLLLFGLLTNPVRVSETPATTKPAEVFYLLDSSESMAMGNGPATRWNDAIDLIRESSHAAFDRPTANVSLFRFGRRLQAIANPAALGVSQTDDVSSKGGVTFSRLPARSGIDEAPGDADIRLVPDEPDTQMLVALRQLSSRFGREPPAAIVLFSDGRARDASRLSEIAQHFVKLQVPIHVVPIGDTAKGGDISVVSVVAPTSIRKQSRVTVHAFLRSFGYDDQRTVVELSAVDESGQLLRQLDSTPITLRTGFQSVSLAFQSDLATHNLRVSIPPRVNEISTDNNAFDADITIDRTKIRVLYLEGSPMRFDTVHVNGRVESRGPHSDLQNALQDDPDIECAVLAVSGSRVQQVSGQIGSFPRTVAELSAFDTIILSSVPRSAFNDQQIQWLQSWIGRRGGGLCMVGGRYSFGAGGWGGTAVEKMLPVQLAGGNDWNSALPVDVEADTGNPIHPLFRFLDDENKNRALLGALPNFRGANVHLRPKPSLTTVLAVGSASGKAPRGTLFSAEGIRRLFSSEEHDIPAVDEDTEFPVVVVGQYGKGRTMAMSTPIAGDGAKSFREWGTRGREYYGKFWRNAVYWLTENSFVGRRRLVASADKRYYRPGETITLSALAYDEAANPTTDYRLVGLVEPQSFDSVDSDYSLLRWPNNLQRPSGEDGPFVAWGEEFGLPVTKLDQERDGYRLELPIADALSTASANQSMRIELTAYEDYTQVDSTSVAVQVLHDPFEQQNPFPNHELLAQLAGQSGGQVLVDAQSITNMLAKLPVRKGPAEVRKTPLWNSWWLLIGMLGVLTAEWCWRRRIGLA